MPVRPHTGLEIDGFTLGEKLHTGGFATIWEVTHPLYRTPMVMKVPTILDGYDGPTIVGGNSMSSWVLTQVGFTRPAAQEKINSQGRSGDKVSLENLDLIDADYLFFGVLAGKEKAAEELSAARKLPGFGTLGANRSGNVLPVDGVPWTSGSGPLGVKSVLAEVAAAAG